MITLTSHNPFKMPEEYQVLNIKAEHKDTLLGNYIQSVHYLDKALGEFIEELKKEGLYDESLLVIYGDHFAINSLNKDDQKNDDGLFRLYLRFRRDDESTINNPYTSLRGQ